MLLFCVVIIIVLVVLAVLYTKNKIKEERLETLKTDMLAIEGKIKIVSQEISMKKEGVDYIGQNLSQNLEDEKIKQLINNQIIVDEEKKYDSYYILVKEDFDTLGISDYTIDRVIVDYKTCEIIYIDGFKINEKVYYKLSDLKEIEIKDSNKDENENINDDVENANENDTQDINI